MKAFSEAEEASVSFTMKQKMDVSFNHLGCNSLSSLWEITLTALCLASVIILVMLYVELEHVCSASSVVHSAICFDSYKFIKTKVLGYFFINSTK